MNEVYEKSKKIDWIKLLFFRMAQRQAVLADIVIARSL
jgi:hypothetical protein